MIARRDHITGNNVPDLHILSLSFMLVDIVQAQFACFISKSSVSCSGRHRLLDPVTYWQISTPSKKKWAMTCITQVDLSTQLLWVES